MKSGKILAILVLVISLAVLLGSAQEASAATLAAWGIDDGSTYDYGQCDVPAGNDFVAIAAGRYHSLALKSDGSLAAWGHNGYGQCDVPIGNDFVAVAGGLYHSLALKSDGSLAAWVRNDFGQCDVPAGNDFADIAAGYFHSLALKSDGSLAAWGNDSQGQVSNVPAGNDFAAVAAGGYQSLALRSDGSLAAWGSNAYGEGNVPAGNDFVAIAAGAAQSLALKSDGSVVGWGLDNYGQVSDIPAGNDFVAIAAGWQHSLALKSDGSLAAWGIVDGSTYDYGQVTDAPAGNDFVAIAAGYYHSLALRVVRAAFTYQGRLMDTNSPADGLYDFQFKLFDDANTVTGNQVGITIDIGHLDVIDGYFTVELDFGSGVFDGARRWLQAAVRPGDSSGGFTILSPRQELTPTPYAVYAAQAAYAASCDWDNLTGVPAGFADGTDNDAGGDITAVSAGTGLNGGGTSGDVTLKVTVPLSLSGSSSGGIIRGSNSYITGLGVYGEHSASGNFGYLGAGGYGVYGRHGSSGNCGYLGSRDYAGYFQGDVKINGTGKGVIFPDGTKQTTAAMISNIAQVKKIYLIAPNDSKTCTVDCPTGYTVLGGGWESRENQPPYGHSRKVHAYYNAPYENWKGWKVGIRNESSDYHNLTVFAICGELEY